MPTSVVHTSGTGTELDLATMSGYFFDVFHRTEAGRRDNSLNKKHNNTVITPGTHRMELVSMMYGRMVAFSFGLTLRILDFGVVTCSCLPHPPGSFT